MGKGRGRVGQGRRGEWRDLTVDDRTVIEWDSLYTSFFSFFFSYVRSINRSFLMVRVNAVH